MEEFDRARVEYVVVGGYAVAFHGRPRATKDLDLVLRGSAVNLDHAARALDAFGAAPHLVEAVRTMGVNEVVYMGQPPMRVDFLRTIEGVSSDELFSRAVRIDLDGVRLALISLEDLIANKRAVDRPRDRDDAAFLERVRDRRRP